MITAIICGFLTLAAASPASAATYDEIIAMQDAGIAPEIIIEVIEATGLDEPLDVDALIYLAENDVDPMILDFLIDALPSDSAWVDLENNLYSYLKDISEHPNWAGGDGFHRGGTGYNPLRDRDDDYYYRDRSDYYYNYYQNYPGDYRIRIYEPPVYILNDNPYRAYRVPRHYNYRSNRWWNPYTHNYQDNPHWDRRYYPHGWPGGIYYYDDGWGIGYRGGWRHHGWRDRWDSSISFWWYDDDFGLRFSF